MILNLRPVGRREFQSYLGYTLKTLFPKGDSGKLIATMGETSKAVHLDLTQSQKMNSHVTWLHKVFCLFRKFSLHMQVKNEDVLTETCTAMLFLVLANLLNVKLQDSKSYKQ